MSLLTAPIYLSKKRPTTNLNPFQYQILTTEERPEKQLASKANFSTFLQLSCLNLKVKTGWKALELQKL